MDNATEGLYIAASILIFVMAVSVTIFLFSQLVNTASVVYETALKPSYFSEIEIDRVNNLEGSKRVVDKTEVISSLYRYPVQSVAVTILDKDGKEYHVFDKYIESKIRELARKSNLTDIEKEFLKKFNTKDKVLYLFEAPWVASTETHRERVDLFINSQKGYIDGQVIDYKTGTNKGLDGLNSDKFIETILNYKISGDGWYDEETNTDVVTTELGTYKTEIIYQAIN